jgi:hypothetical protein
MDIPEFKLQSREDVINFQAHLTAYLKKSIGWESPYIDLLVAYDKLIPHERQGALLFSGLMDLKINFTLVVLDNFHSGAAWNELCSATVKEEKSVLDDFPFFYGRMEVHRHNANFVFRYRAIWDKIMGILVLLHSEEEYKRFSQAKSKKKFFKKLAPKMKFLPPDYAEVLLAELVKFDDAFRTREIHGFGILRKWSFVMGSFHETPLIDLKNHWNWLLHHLITLEKIIASIS